MESLSHFMTSISEDLVSPLKDQISNFVGNLFDSKELFSLDDIEDDTLLSQQERQNVL